MQDADHKVAHRRGWVRWVALVGSVLVGAATIVAAVPVVRDVFFRDSQASADQGITIDPLDGGRIPICATVRGSAPVKDGLVLWAGMEWYDLTLFKVTREEGERWRFSKRIGGPDYNGRTIQIHVFYLNQRDSQFLEGASATGKDRSPATVHYKDVPPGALGQAIRTVVHDGSGDASC